MPMTEKEYAMSFDEYWARKQRGVVLDEYGRIDMGKTTNKFVLENPQWLRDVWNQRRGEYDYFRRTQAALNAINVLSLSGYSPRLMCMDNLHIQVNSKHGRLFNYYAGTGTIMGYGQTDVRGLNALLELLKNS